MTPTDIQREARELAERINRLWTDAQGAPLDPTDEEVSLHILAFAQRIQQEGAKQWALKIVQKMHDDYCMNAESGMTDPETGERTFDKYESSRIETLEEVMEALRAAHPDERKET